MRGFLGFTIFKFGLGDEASCFNKLNVIVGAGADVFIIHQSFESDDPRPFLVAIFPTEVKLVVLRPDFEAGWNHLFVFSQVAFVGFYFFEVDYIGDLFTRFVCEGEDVVHGQDNPTFTPLF